VVQEALRAIRDNRTRLIRVSPEPGAAPLPEGVSEVPMTCFSGGTLDIFIQPHLPRPRLLVAGRSPVAEALVRLGGAMGYELVVVDPGGEGELEGTLETLHDVGELAAHVTPLTFVVVATHGTFDEPALAAALRTEAPYVGLVSSHARGEAVRRALLADGIPEEALRRLKLPAGLDIGARGGDEIALSILAELIQVRRSLEEVDWPEGKEPVSPEREPEGDTATDPVCGMSVTVEGALHTFQHEGRSYYFCCGGCRARFQSNPAAFVQAG
jgi:xanthine dehydrogenase accessory factor